MTLSGLTKKADDEMPSAFLLYFDAVNAMISSRTAAVDRDR